ncbi:MAG: RsmE family RNA methyltransferase, partial [Gammaproteobacteria bacterium]
DEERAQRRIERWRKVAIHACEQCGRNTLPTVGPVVSLDAALRESRGLGLVLHPQAGAGLRSIGKERDITLLVGPEGGLSRGEVQAALEKGFRGLRLGPRILRTETAAVAALAAIQTLWGDLA